MSLAESSLSNSAPRALDELADLGKQRAEAVRLRFGAFHGLKTYTFHGVVGNSIGEGLMVVSSLIPNVNPKEPTPFNIHVCFVCRVRDVLGVFLLLISRRISIS